MREKILNLLLEAKDFISGEEMSNHLGVSRAAIWKHIKKLKEEGFVIKSVSNKGYRLYPIPDHFEVNELMDLLSPYDVASSVFVYDTLDSTNKEAKRRAAENSSLKGLFIAKEQTQGIGRRGRSWISEKDGGIYMSLLLRLSIKPVHASMLTLLAGLAVCRVIRRMIKAEAYIKWPNDIVLQGKKIAGILTEMSSEIDYVHYVVIGIGINVNHAKFDKELDERATSLRIEEEQEYDKKELLVKTIEEFQGLYDVFLKEQSLNFLVEEYNAFCVNVGKKVKVEENNKTVIGKALGIDGSGALVIQTKEETTKIIHSGEVSVRGLYGYVD